LLHNKGYKLHYSDQNLKIPASITPNLSVQFSFRSSLRIWPIFADLP